MFTQYLKARLLETSSWRGLFLLVSGVIGYFTIPEMRDTWMSQIFMGAGAIGLAFPDKIKKQ